MSGEGEYTFPQPISLKTPLKAVLEPQVWRYRKIVKEKLEEGDYQKEDDTPYTSRKPDGYDF